LIIDPGSADPNQFRVDVKIFDKHATDNMVITVNAYNQNSNLLLKGHPR